MTKRNPIPPGMDYCIDCPKMASKSSRPQSNITPPGMGYFDMEFVKPPGYGSRHPKESLEPDWNTPSALVFCDEDKPSNNALNWFFFLALAFAMGAFCAMVALSKWP